MWQQLVQNFQPRRGHFRRLRFLLSGSSPVVSLDISRLASMVVIPSVPGTAVRHASRSRYRFEGKKLRAARRHLARWQAVDALDVVENRKNNPPICVAGGVSRCMFEPVARSTGRGSGESISRDHRRVWEACEVHMGSEQAACVGACACGERVSSSVAGGAIAERTIVPDRSLRGRRTRGPE